MSIHLALGRRMLGKTTLVYSMARKCPFRIVLDPRNMIHTADSVRVASSADFLAAFKQMLYAPDSDPRIHELIWTPRENLADALNVSSAAVTTWFETSDARMMFLIDEARFFPNLAQSQQLDYVLRASPPGVVDVAITAHRPKDIPTDIRAISDYWLMFKHVQRHDLDVIEERCGEKVQRQVEALEPYQFIEWDDGRAAATAYRDPSKWFVPLNAGHRAAPIALLDRSGGESVSLVDKGTLF